MKPTVTFVVTGLLVLGACEVSSRSQDSFSVEAEDGHLVLTNGLADTVRYWALEEEISARIESRPVEEWSSLAPGEEKRIPYEYLEGYTPAAKQARVYWWTESDGYKDHIVADL